MSETFMIYIQTSQNTRVQYYALDRKDIQVSNEEIVSVRVKCQLKESRDCVNSSSLAEFVNLISVDMIPYGEELLIFPPIKDQS